MEDEETTLCRCGPKELLVKKAFDVMDQLMEDPDASDGEGFCPYSVTAITLIMLQTCDIGLGNEDMQKVAKAMNELDLGPLMKKEIEERAARHEVKVN